MLQAETVRWMDLSILVEGLSRPPPAAVAGVMVSVEEWRAHLYETAEQVDLFARAMHDRIAYELDSLGVATP